MKGESANIIFGAWQALSGVGFRQIIKKPHQVYINDKQYLQEMLEHHSMAIFTSEEILKKTNDYNIAKLAKNIIQTQKDEITEMRELLSK